MPFFFLRPLSRVGLVINHGGFNCRVLNVGVGVGVVVVVVGGGGGSGGLIIVRGN